MYRELPFALDGAVVWTRTDPTYATTPSDPARHEAPRGDPSRDDAARGDPSRVEGSRGEAARDEAARDEAARDEAARDEAARVQGFRGVASRGEAAEAAQHRVLPDGCLDIIWVDGAMIVAGPDTRPHLTPVRAGACYVGVRFRPGQGPGVLGVPAAELRDHRLALEQLWPNGEVRRLTEVVNAATNRPAALATEIGRYLRRAGPVDPRADAVSARLRAGHSVAVTAGAVGLGPRQLYRMSLAAFGYGPKTLARVLRFDRAVALARAGVAFATVAATAGYADQAHLCREVRELAGVPLRDLVA